MKNFFAFLDVSDHLEAKKINKFPLRDGGRGSNAIEWKIPLILFIFFLTPRLTEYDAEDNQKAGVTIFTHFLCFGFSNFLSSDSTQTDCNDILSALIWSGEILYKVTRLEPNTNTNLLCSPLYSLQEKT